MEALLEDDCLEAGIGEGKRAGLYHAQIGRRKALASGSDLKVEQVDACRRETANTQVLDE
jgi:hypothetical protein